MQERARWKVDLPGALLKYKIQAQLKGFVSNEDMAPGLKYK